MAIGGPSLIRRYGEPVRIPRALPTLDPWTPTDAGANLVVALDPHDRATCAWQDASKTIQSRFIGSTVRKYDDDWSGEEWTVHNTTVARLAIGNLWGEAEPGNDTAWGIDTRLGALKVTPTSTISSPFTVVMRFRAWGSGACVLMSGTNFSIDLDSSGRLHAATTTGFQTTGSVKDTDKHTITVEVNGSSSQIYLDGALVASGTMASISGLATLNIGVSGSTYYPVRFYRTVVVTGVASNSRERRQKEAWAEVDDETPYSLLPYLFYSFNGSAWQGAPAESFGIWESSDMIDWRMAKMAYKPAATGSFRDPCAVQVGSDYYMGFTRYGFEKGRSFDILKATDFPLDWTEHTTVDCSSVISDVNGARCWFSHLYYEGSTLYALFSATSVNPFDDTGFVMYETHATSPFTSWSSPTAFSGTKIPSNAIDHHLYKIGSTYYLLFKDETTKNLKMATNSSLVVTGWDAGRTFSEISGEHEGEGVLDVPGVPGSKYLFTTAYLADQPERFKTADNWATNVTDYQIMTFNADGPEYANGQPWVTP